MKKTIAILGILVSLFMFVGCDEKVKETLVKIEVCEEFKTQIIYVGDELDFADYTLKLTYSTKRTEEIALEPSMVSRLETSSAGSKNVTITYGGKTESIVLQVLAAAPVNIRYVGDELVFFVGEACDFSGVFIRVLYADTTEQDIPLSSVTIKDLNTDNITDDRTFIVEYCGLSASVNYKVTYREISLNTTYDFDFLGESYKACFYEDDDGIRLKFMDKQDLHIVYNIEAIEIDHNQFSFTFATKGVSTFNVALVNGKLVVTDQEASAV